MSSFFAAFPTQTTAAAVATAAARARAAVPPWERSAVANAKSRTGFRGAMRRRVETRFRESGKTAPLAVRRSFPLNGWLVAAADGISLAGVPWESEEGGI